MNILLQLMHDTMGKTARIKGCVNLLQQGCLPKIDEIKLLEIIETSAEELNNVLDAHYIECKEDNHTQTKNIKTPEEIRSLGNQWALDNADETMATNSALNKGFRGGYNKCQEDNSDKYIFTKDELQKLIVQFVGFTHDHNEARGIIATRFIESLNKQD